MTISSQSLARASSRVQPCPVRTSHRTNHDQLNELTIDWTDQLSANDMFLLVASPSFIGSLPGRTRPAPRIFLESKCEYDAQRKRSRPRVW